MFAAAVVLIAIISGVFVYSVFTRPDREAPAQISLDDSTANRGSTHGWHASGANSGERHPLPPPDGAAAPPARRLAADATRPADETRGRTKSPAADKPTARIGGTPTAATKSGNATPLAGDHRSGQDQPPPLPTGENTDLSISGRVLNQSKDPVPGIEVSARKSSNRLNTADAGSAQSADDGRYEIRGLAEGEYEIRTAATDRYQAGQTMARAGFSSADIILEGDYEIRVTGTVTDINGRSLAAVRVVPADSQRQTQTDDSGNYETYLVIKREEGIYTFQFLAKGYHDKLVYVNAADLAGVQETRVDAQLEPAGETTVVNGVVAGEDGAPVVGASVQLQSPFLKTSYSAMSGGDGRFSIPEVRVGTDYRLTVFPSKRYRDYEQEPVAVVDGVVLDISLQSLDTGRLTGHMVDADGRAIARFSLWLSSSDTHGQSVQVSGDESGAFVVDPAPAGALTFFTRSVPQLVVSGIMLAAGESQDALLVLDWGDQVLAGHVTDNRGSPVAGAQVSLSWSTQAEGVVSNSARTASTDAAGSFSLTQLGPGSHTLNVRGPGSGAQQGLEVPAGTRDVEVRLP